MILDVTVATLFAGPILKGDALTERLNQLGAEGWELVSTSTLQVDSGRTRTFVCILKRPRD
jgi:hypothetical protein